MPTRLIQPRTRGADEKRMTPNEQLFVKALMADPQWNTTRAARAAGCKNPSQDANRMLKSPVVQAALGKAVHERAKRFDVKAEDVLRELIAIGGANIQDLVDEDGLIIPLHELPRELATAIKSFKVVEKVVQGDDGEPITMRVSDVVFHDKLTALEMLAKHLGLFEKDNAQTKPTLNFDISQLYQRPITDDPVERLIANPVMTPKALERDADIREADAVDPKVIYQVGELTEDR